MKKLIFYGCLCLELLILNVLIRVILYSFLIDDLKLSLKICTTISLICYGFTLLGTIFCGILYFIQRKMK